MQEVWRFSKRGELRSHVVESVDMTCSDLAKMPCQFESVPPNEQCKQNRSPVPLAKWVSLRDTTPAPDRPNLFRSLQGDVEDSSRTHRVCDG